MRGGIEMRGLLCDPLTQLLELIVHGDWISPWSDIIPILPTHMIALTAIGNERTLFLRYKKIRNGGRACGRGLCSGAGVQHKPVPLPTILVIGIAGVRMAGALQALAVQEVVSCCLDRLFALDGAVAESVGDVAFVDPTSPTKARRAWPRHIAIIAVGQPTPEGM